jgi:hypothetical protein
MTYESSVGADPVYFSIGKVLTTAFAVLIRNLAPFAAVALILGIPFILVSDWSTAETVPGHPNYGAQGIKLLVGLLTSALTTSALTYGTFQDLRGQRAGFGDILARGFSSIGKVLPASIGYAFMVGLGTLMLIIPGVVLAVVLWVFIPALVVEQCSIGESFSRSAGLTGGKRWQVFALLLIGFLIQVGFALAVGFIAGFVIAIGGGAGAGLGWLTAVIQLLVGVFSAVMATVGYYYLRAEKEGVMIDDLAQVFD